jgi:hypothetical protein
MEIRDLGSTNGTWVNGSRIEGATTLADGGVIRVGQTVFAVEVEPALERSGIPAGVPEKGATRAAQAPPPAPAPPVAVATAVAVAVTAPAPAVPSTPPPPSLPGPEDAGVRRPRRRSVASRQALAIFLSIATVVATAAALLAYFALR